MLVLCQILKSHALESVWRWNSSKQTCILTNLDKPNHNNLSGTKKPEPQSRTPKTIKHTHRTHWQILWTRWHFHAKQKLLTVFFSHSWKGYIVEILLCVCFETDNFKSSFKLISFLSSQKWNLCKTETETETKVRSVIHKRGILQESRSRCGVDWKSCRSPGHPPMRETYRLHYASIETRCSK